MWSSKFSLFSLIETLYNQIKMPTVPNTWKTSNKSNHKWRQVTSTANNPWSYFETITSTVNMSAFLHSTHEATHHSRAFTTLIDAMPPFNLGDLSQQKASVGCKSWSLPKSKQLKLGKPFRITMHLLCIYKSFCKEQKDEQGLSYSTKKRPTEWNLNMNLLKFKDGHVISSQWEQTYPWNLTL